jgi:hypothetical protein
MPGITPARYDTKGRRREVGDVDLTDDPGEYAAVIVRIRRDRTGRATGVVERVGTGDTIGFRGLETLGEAVAALLATRPDGSSLNPKER